MGQRRHHYEGAFEQYLRSRRLPYIVVDEAKKALLPADAHLRLAHGPEFRQASLKSFDFVIYGEPVNYLVEVKGRRLASRVKVSTVASAIADGQDGGGGRTKRMSSSRGRPSVRLESWVTVDDVESLQCWQQLFGSPFRSVFVFLYWCDEMPPGALFEEIFEFRDRWYAVRAVEVDSYVRVMRPRSTRWRTVHLSSQSLDALSVPLCGRNRPDLDLANAIRTPVETGLSSDLGMPYDPEP